jgi:hypothetical protein
MPFIIVIIGHNYRIYTYDAPGNDWVLRGRYEVALRDDDDLEWSLINNEWILQLLVVQIEIIQLKLFINFLYIVGYT